MIYTTGGTPLNKALMVAKLAYAERLQMRGPYGREFRRPVYLMDGKRRLATVGRDKNGDVFAVYREIHVHRPGRGCVLNRAAKIRVLTGALDAGKTETQVLLAAQ